MGYCWTFSLKCDADLMTWLLLLNMLDKISPKINWEWNAWFYSWSFLFHVFLNMKL